MSTLTARIIAQQQLADDIITAMYALYEAYYESTSAALFAQDLAEKSHVIALFDEGQLRGFSTLLLQDSPASENGVANARVLFSGDTIIHHEYWGNQTLADAFCHFAGQVKAQQPDVPLYWFLISKGYRTYRYLHLFSRTYWPHFATRQPSPLQTLLNSLARKRFGDAYDPLTGLIRFPSSRGQLRTDWAGIRDNLKDRPEVEFFLQRNPHYAQGEELACITLLQEDNLRSRARTAFAAGLDEARTTLYSNAA